MDREKLFFRMLEVIEGDIVPLTARGVSIGCKVFGAAVLRKDDLSLVVAGTNHEAFSPLWHGEVYTIKLFYELQGHPDPSECLFLSTHEPCSMCTSALAWAGFGEIYYFFGYEQTQDDFNIPHDLRMLREVFGCAAPSRDNIYFKSRSLIEMAEGLDDHARAKDRIARVKETYAGLSAVYQAGEKRMVLK